MPFVDGTFITENELVAEEAALALATPGTAKVKLRYEVEVTHNGSITFDVDLAKFEVWCRDNIKGDPEPTEKNLTKYLSYEPGIDIWVDRVDLTPDANSEIDYRTTEVSQVINITEGVRPRLPVHHTQVTLDIEGLD